MKKVLKTTATKTTSKHPPRPPFGMKRAKKGSYGRMEHGWNSMSWIKRYEIMF